MAAAKRVQNIANQLLTANEPDQVCIGDVCMPLRAPNRPECVPWRIDVDLDNENILEVLRWMMQKDLLEQDMFLLANPGPLTRHIALAWCSLVRREVQVISLHRDTSAESDLKQRREIVRVVDVEDELDEDGEEVIGRRMVADAVTNLSRLRADWIDSLVVRAAVEGHVLVIEGVEKAERNVMPVLNNLLENREVNLEDGRQLVHPKFWDSLLEQGHTAQELQDMQLVRVHPQFRCIAIGISAPPHRGNPLDPPFRSRFQCKWVGGHARGSTRFANVEFLSVPETLPLLKSTMKDIVYLMETIAFSQRIESLSASSSTAQLASFSQTSISTLTTLINTFPEESNEATRFHLLERVYPYVALHGGMQLDQRKTFYNFLIQFRLALPNINVPQDEKTAFDFVFAAVKRVKQRSAYKLQAASKATSQHPFPDLNVPRMQLNFHATRPLSLCVASGPMPPRLETDTLSDGSRYIALPRFEDALVRMIQSHVTGSDVCLVGPKGSGKSSLVKRFADVMGYSNGWTEGIFCYKDMTARDVLQRRGTRRDGSTYWENSPLVHAALCGKLLVLHDVEFLEAGTLGSLARLFQDREVEMPDGRRLMSLSNFTEIMDRKGWSAQFLMTEKGIYPIHPSFRVVAVATTPSHVSAGTPLRDALPWLTDEVTNMFQFVVWCGMEKEEERDLVLQATGCSLPKAAPLFDLVELLRKSEDGDVSEKADLAAGNALSKTVSLSTRQLIRICKRMARDSDEDLHRALHRACLYPFLSLLAKQALDQMLDQVGIQPKPRATQLPPPIQDWTQTPPMLVIQDVKLPIYHIEDVEGKALVPKVPGAFFDNDQQTSVMREMAIDLLLGSHLLLLGVQGVGKNRITDRLLELLNRARNYIQLHRDTSVSQLLTQVSIENGAIVYKDSPLIEAMIHGRVMVIDEADKAPVYITSVLKSLAETSEMLLPDGRKVLPASSAHLASRRDVVVHPDFCLILLANRAGSGFLGNDFYASIGDVFATHCVENPDFESEFQMACKAAPALLPGRVKRMVHIFQDLRREFDNGRIQYPFSLRELLHVLRHMQTFPNDPVESVLNNVFDFDAQRPEVMDVLREVLKKQDVDVRNFGLNMMTKAKEDERRAKRGSVELKFQKRGKPVMTEKLDKVEKSGSVDKEEEGEVQRNGVGEAKGMGAGSSGGGGGFRMQIQGGELSEFSDALGLEVTDEMRLAAMQNSKDRLDQRLAEIGMDKADARMYHELYSSVKNEIQQLRVVLEGVKAKEKERVWLKNQTDGEIDDRKLIDGLTGERAVYKKRGESNDPEMQKKPKRLLVLWDLSGSMYRYNGVDGRLTRSLEAAVMIMEALHGLERKYAWQFYGHSGDGDWIPLLEDQVPRNEAERFKVIQKMLHHAQTCNSGDSTFSSVKRGITEIASQDADEYQVIVTSDSNFGRYGQSVAELGNILTKTDSRVNATCLFIGTAGDEATKLQKQLPPGKAYVCLTTESIPNIIKEIFTSIVG